MPRDEERPRQPDSRLRPPCRAALALLVLALVACGGGTADSGDDPAAVRRDVTKALTTADPRICELRRYATRRFVEQDAFSIPELVAVNAKTCRADVRGFTADTLRLSRVKVAGDRATARLVADGGAYGYGTIDLALVRDHVWKLDRITAVDVDRARFDALQAQFARVGHQTPSPSLLACAKRRLARLSDAQIERAVVRGDSTLVSDPLLVCVVRPQLRRALSTALTSCVVAQLRRDDDELVRALLGGDERAGDKLFARAGERCTDAARGSTA
ncbi:MAG TPA: hypothetical protein VGO80_00040 [Solirubrobacteraceae bacterium]|nr:hypothetical protein [Solirubrobacteraceae bacterium]